MPTPNLIHPVPVTIEQIDKPATLYDEDAREPIQFAARATSKTIAGQVKWGSQFDETTTRVGTVEGASGYVLFRQIDLTAAGVELQLEDRFSRIGTRDTDVYITRLRPVGHYPDHSGHTMIKAFFDDRQPSKQTRG